MNKNLLYRTTLWLGLLATVLVIVVSTKAFGDGYIKGIVTRSGKPARSVWVTVIQNGTEKGSSPTGDDGRYYIGALDYGVYDIVVTQGDQRICQRQLRLPDSNGINDIELPCLKP